MIPPVVFSLLNVVVGQSRPELGDVAGLVLFFIETLWINISARLKWKTVLYGCWVITLVAGGVNILILMLDK